MNEKETLRKKLLDLRREFGAEYRESAAKQIAKQVRDTEAWKRASLVLFYCPVAEEVDVSPLFSAARLEGKRLAFPRCVDREMEFCTVEDVSELERGRFGIPAPKERLGALTGFSEALVIVPALAADRRGTRLGYGGGFYDRFLQKHPLPALCCLYEKMLQELLPREPFDIPVNIIVTENGVIDCHEA